MNTLTIGFCYTNVYNERLLKAATTWLNHNGFTGTIVPKLSDSVWKLTWMVPMNEAEQNKAQAFQSQFTQVSRRFIFAENTEFSGVWVTFPMREKFGEAQRIHFYYQMQPVVEANRLAHEEVRMQLNSPQALVIHPNKTLYLVKKG